MLRLIYMLAVTSPSIRCCFSVYEAAKLLLSGLETGRKDLAKSQKRCGKDAISIYKMFGHRLSRKVSECCSKSV